MRRNIRKQDYATPTPLVNCTEELLDIAQNKAVDKIKDSIYKGTKPDYLVRATLKQIYFDKCAYCENTEHEPEVEHYRPKKGVSELSRHDGYYWLCYEWTNLLPSCRYCNTSGGKGNKFPIQNEANREYQPIFSSNGSLDATSCQAYNRPLLDEAPYLLHPEIDTPEECLKFDNNGNIFGTDALGRGEKTIEICNLKRENLRVARQKIIDSFVNKINYLFDLYIRRSITSYSILEQELLRIFIGMIENTDANKPFSLVAIQCLSRFDELVLPLFPGAMHPILETILSRFPQFTQE
jgi:hypothetical protein